MSGKIFGKRTIWFYMELVAAAIMIIDMVLGFSTQGLLKNRFPSYIALFAVLGILVEIIYIFVDLNILPLVTTFFYALTLGMIANQGTYVFSDYVNGVNFFGGNFRMTVCYMVLAGVALLLSILALFNDQKKMEQEPMRD